MIELRSARKLEETYGKKIDSILAKSFDDAISLFCNKIKSFGHFIEVESHSDSKLRLKIGCDDRDFKVFKTEFHVSYLNALAHNLELAESERVELGRAFHKGGVGNNSEFPIYVLTKTRKILIGYLYSNQPLELKSHYIFVENTVGVKVYPNIVHLFRW